MKISVGASCYAKTWKNQDWTWEKLTEKLAAPVRTWETVQEYRKLDRDKQSQIKDIGGFVGGELKDGKRGRTTVLSRSMITLDADFATPEFWDVVSLLFDCRLAVYSTHKHTPAKPRLRLIIPLSRPVDPDEYEAIARKVAESIEQDWFDDTTYQPSRLMYWPSCSKDGEYFYQQQDGDALDPDAVLAEYDDWHDVSEWPISSREQQKRRTLKDKQADPLKKKGVVGAFCRTYTITEAIDKFLPDKYEETVYDDRYTYVGASTAAGLVIYDNDTICYSNHQTDPISGLCCNAFDLVRIHLYGNDEGGKNSASYKAMAALATQDGPTKKTIVTEGAEHGKKDDFAGLNLQDFDADQREESENDDWKADMDITENGTLAATRRNVLRILYHDEGLKGAFAYDELAQTEVALKGLPWRKINNKADRYLKDADDACMRIYLETYYKGTDSPSKAMDAMKEVCIRNSFHPVREYLNGLEWDGVPRVETLLLDYFDVESPEEYVRAVTRKTLAAAVARVMNPGCKFDQVLTLKGPQGCGKSTLFAKLGGDWFSDTIGGMNGDKNAMESLQGVWIMELGELDAVKKSENSAVKAFISKVDDFYRSAFAKRKEVRPRQLIFVATTNEGNFLRDETGGRRWWIVDLKASPEGRHVWDKLTDEEIGQIWAEAVQIYKAGEDYQHLDYELDAIAKELQESHREDAPKKGMIEGYLDLLLPEDWADRTIDERRVFIHGSEYADKEVGTVRRDNVCAAEIWCELYQKELADMRRMDTKEINDLIDQVGGWRKTRTPRRFAAPYGNQRGFTRC